MNELHTPPKLYKQYFDNIGHSFVGGYSITAHDCADHSAGMNLNLILFTMTLIPKVAKEWDTKARSTV